MCLPKLSAVALAHFQVSHSLVSWFAAGREAPVQRQFWPRLLELLGVSGRGPDTAQRFNLSAAPVQPARIAHKELPRRLTPLQTKGCKPEFAAHSGVHNSITEECASIPPLNVDNRNVFPGPKSEIRVTIVMLGN